MSLVYNLIEGIDVQLTEKKIHEYKRKNQAAIALNSGKIKL